MAPPAADEPASVEDNDVALHQTPSAVEESQSLLETTTKSIGAYSASAGGGADGEPEMDGPPEAQEAHLQSGVCFAFDRLLVMHGHRSHPLPAYESISFASSMQNPPTLHLSLMIPMVLFANP